LRRYRDKKEERSLDPFSPLEISDNGVGFDPSIESQGQGLRSMKRRASALGGSFEIHSHPGQETTVSASIPFAGARRVWGIAVPYLHE